jgi:hypothetical protein
VSEPSGAGEQSVDLVIEGWARLFTYLVIAIVAGCTVVMPFPGLLLALAGSAYLRAGDVHTRRHPGGLLRLLAGPLTAPLDLIRGSAGVLIAVPYAAVAAVVLPLAIMAASAFNVEVHPLVGAAWGAGAASYLLLAAPGVRVPRRHLVRVFRALAREPWLIAVIGAVLCALALAALVGAIVLRPSFAPMYELENSIVQALSRFQDSVHQRVS